MHAAAAAAAGLCEVLVGCLFCTLPVCYACKQPQTQKQTAWYEHIAPFIPCKNKQKIFW
jgi:hypothetical protein